MPRKYFKKFLPTPDSVKNNRMLRMFGDTLLHPSLWQIHRRSVAISVAIGMFCGLIPGPFQMLGAAIGAVVFRVNLPVAMVVTIYTNPFTIIPLYLLAYRIGSLVLHEQNGTTIPQPPDWLWSEPIHSAHHLLQWMLELGPALALGVLLLACVLAVAGYVAVRLLWSVYVRLSHRRRRKRD